MANSEIPSMMFAWRKHAGSTEAVWDEVPVPPTPADGFLVKILAAGVCHSDHTLINMKQHMYGFNETYTLGHEGCGEIVRLGTNVKENSKFRLGTKVAILAVPGCGEDDCSECSRNLPQICLRGHHHGLGQDGSFAPYVAVRPRAAVPLPDGVTPAQGAVATDAVLTAYHGLVRRAEVKKGELVFVFGLGGLGFNALQILQHIGVRVIVSDVRKEVLDTAEKFGVPKEDIVPAGKSIPEFVQERGLTNKIDTVADFVGKKQTFSDAQQIVRFGGKILSVGILDPETNVDTTNGILKRITVLFTYGGQYQDMVELLDLISKGVIQPQVETSALKDFPQVLKELHEGMIKSRMALVPSNL